MADRAGKNVRYNSPPRRVADPLRGRYVGRRIEFPAATRAIIDAERAEANARGEIYLIPLRFMPENEYIEPPANLQRNRRHEPAYLRANRAAARAAAAAAEEEEEADVVKKIKFEGATYLKSKKSGIVYNMEQDVIGKWDEATQKIIFNPVDAELEEDECDSDSE